MLRFVLALSLAIASAVPVAPKAAVEGTLTLQAIADMNPDKTKAACDKCVKGQSAAEQAQADALDAADAVSDVLKRVNAAESEAKEALKAEKAALDAYQKAQEALSTAEANLVTEKAAQKAAEDAETTAKAAAGDSLTAMKTACAGFNLPAINEIPNPPSPPPPPVPPPPYLVSSAAEAKYMKTPYDLSKVWDDGGGRIYMHPAHGGANQKFYVEKQDGVTHNGNQIYYVKIASLASSKCLDWDYGNSRPVMWDCHAGANQQWYFWDGDGSTQGSAAYLSTVYADGKCLDYNYSNGELYLNDCHSGDNQKFFLSS